MLVLSRRQVEELLDVDALIDSLAAAMADLSSGRASMPLRIAARSEAGLLAAMPAYLPSARALTSKLVTLFPGNAERDMATHQAAIVAFDPETGTPVALMDGTFITATRTAAGSALATRLLARDDASVLAILGTGVQARSHGRVVPRVGRFEEIRVAGRDATRADGLAKELQAETGLQVRACRSYQEALRGADVACATTHSPDPVIRRAWLSPGVHVNSVGLNPEGAEVDAPTVADSLVVVESRPSALAPFPAGANDLAWPIGDGLLAERDVVEVGELVSGERVGRTTPEQLTLYKSVGVAAQDAAAAALVLRAARERGAGLRVEL